MQFAAPHWQAAPWHTGPSTHASVTACLKEHLYKHCLLLLWLWCWRCAATPHTQENHKHVIQTIMHKLDLMKKLEGELSVASVYDDCWQTNLIFVKRHLHLGRRPRRLSRGRREALHLGCCEFTPHPVCHQLGFFNPCQVSQGYPHIVHPSTPTLDSTIKDELQGSAGANARWFHYKILVCTTMGWSTTSGTS